MSCAVLSNGKFKHHPHELNFINKTLLWYIFKMSWAGAILIARVELMLMAPYFGQNWIKLGCWWNKLATNISFSIFHNTGIVLTTRIATGSVLMRLKERFPNKLHNLYWKYDKYIYESLEIKYTGRPLYLCRISP